jgi:hypothetical protein
VSEGEERAVGGAVLELSVDAGGACEVARPGGKWVEPASAVGGAVVDFDGGRCVVDVDTADKRELADVRSGDCLDGDGCRVEGMCHRVQPGGEDVCCVVTLPRGRCAARCRGEHGGALALGPFRAVCRCAVRRCGEGDPLAVVLAGVWFDGPLLSGTLGVGRWRFCPVKSGTGLGEGVDEAVRGLFEERFQGMVGRSVPEEGEADAAPFPQGEELSLAGGGEAVGAADDEVLDVAAASQAGRWESAQVP